MLVDIFRCLTISYLIFAHFSVLSSAIAQIYIKKNKQHKPMDDFFTIFIIANRFPIFRAITLNIF